MQDKAKLKQTIETLREIGIFQSASENVLECMAEHSRRWHCGPNVSLFSREDDADQFYVIVTGSVRLQRVARSGKTVQIALFGPKDHFGELSLLDAETRLGDAVTATACDLITIDREAFARCVLSSPELVLQIAHRFAHRIRRAADDLEARHELDVTGRLAEVLVHLAEHESVKLPDGKVVLCDRTTHAELAELVGTARECISRAIDDLRHIDAIRASGRPTRITVINMDKLRARCKLH